MPEKGHLKDSFTDNTVYLFSMKNEILFSACHLLIGFLKYGSIWPFMSFYFHMYLYAYLPSQLCKHKVQFKWRSADRCVYFSPRHCKRVNDSVCLCLCFMCACVFPCRCVIMPECMGRDVRGEERADVLRLKSISSDIT